MRSPEHDRLPKAPGGGLQGVVDIFWRAPNTRPWIVIFCLLVATLLEGLGIATLLPVILAATGDAGQAGWLHEISSGLLGSVGFEVGLTSLLALVAVTFVAKALFTTAAMSFVGWSAAEVATEFRRRIIVNLLDVRWSYLVHQPLGRFANTLSVDAHKSAQAYELAAAVVATAIQSVIYIGVAVAVSWQVALAGMAAGLLLTGSLSFLVRRSRRAGHAETTRRRELVVFMTDVLNSLKPIRGMGRQQALSRLLDRKTKAIRHSLRQQSVAREAMNNAEDAVLAVLLCGGIYLVHLRMGVPMAEVLVSGILLAKTVSSIGKLQKAYQKAVLVESTYRACVEVIAETAAVPEPPGGDLEPSFEHGLAFERVEFAHEGPAPLLRGVSLVVPTGALTVLTGPSGAGKSTIVDLMLGLHQPTDGRILIDGTPLPQLRLSRWRALVGYAPQDVVLLHDTVHANVTLGDPDLDDAAVREALELAGALGFTEALPEGIRTVVGERGGKLSGGERQRIALARALAKRPKLLILDEVTSALDEKTAYAIAHQVRALTGRMAVLAVTHRPEFVEVADRIYTIRAGEVRLAAPSPPTPIAAGAA